MELFYLVHIFCFWDEDVLCGAIKATVLNSWNNCFYTAQPENAIKESFKKKKVHWHICPRRSCWFLRARSSATGLGAGGCLHHSSSERLLWLDGLWAVPAHPTSGRGCCGRFRFLSLLHSEPVLVLPSARCWYVFLIIATCHVGFHPIELRPSVLPIWDSVA